MSNDSVLSQEEIDALIKGNESNELTDEEKDVFGEIGNIAMGSASTALSTLLDQKVEITTPHLSISTFEEISKEYTRPCVLIKVEYTEGLEGVNLLIINDRDAAVISDLMMGGDGDVKEEDYELDEIHLSAVGEAMNQMMGSAATSMSSIINEIVNISPPEADYLLLDDVINQNEEYFSNTELLVDTSFQLNVGELIDSTFKLLVPIKFSKELISGLIGNENGGLMAKDDNRDDPDIADTDSSRGHEQEKNIDNNTEETIDHSTGTTPDNTSENNFNNGNATQTSVKKGPSTIPGESEKQPAREVEVQRAQFPDFGGGGTTPLPHNIELIKDVPLQVTVRLGQSRMTIKEILELGEGSIVELDKLAGEAVDLLVNGKLVARGEVVVIDESFGFRVKNIISPMDRINNV